MMATRHSKISSKRKKRFKKSSIDYLVFVSHATSDKWIAIQICTLLRTRAKVQFYRDDQEALQKARNIARSHNAVLVVHASDGKIRDVEAMGG